MPCDKKGYSHKRGMGGMGGSPCKFRKREGGLEDGRVITGMHMMTEETKEPPVQKGPASNYH